MRKRYMTLALSLMMSTALLAGCGSNTATDSSQTSSAGETIYGQIQSVDDDSITLEIGTMKEQSENKDADSSTQDSADAAGASENPGDFSMLDLTGETEEITVGDDTTITKQGMGQGPGGQAPDGQAPDGDNNNQPPSKDDSTQPSEKNTKDQGSQPEKPSESQEISVSDLSVGDTISVTTDEEGNITEITVLFSAGMQPGGGGQAPDGQAQGGQTQGVDSYTALKEYTSDETTDGESYESTGTDENAVLVSNGASVTLDNAVITRNSSDSTGGDNSSFYGVGAAVLTTDGTTTINNAQITTDAKGGAGVFSYGSNSVVSVNDTTINTTQDTSGGIHVAGGGTLNASNCEVETNGESSAAIRSDRGGGTMTVDGGTYTSNGTGSPAIYSTADITVSNATLKANNSEAICIEGDNSITLTDCSLSGNMPESDQNDCTWNVILYQSMSGDSEEGNSSFTMTGGDLTAENGGMFYTTNTQSTFTLSDVNITNADNSDFFLKCTGNSNERGWGTSGSNGAQCTFNATDQSMEGDIIWDSISTLDFNMSGASTLTGAIKDDETNAGNGGEGYCKLTIDEDSTWIVTGDSTLTDLTNNGTITDSDGNTVTIKGTDGTVYVNGDSSYTITVDNYAA